LKSKAWPHDYFLLAEWVVMQNCMIWWMIAFTIVPSRPDERFRMDSSFLGDFVMRARNDESTFPPPKNPSPVDVGKGIEAKLDRLLDAIKSLTLDALKAAYFQGVLHGVLATSVMFVILIAFHRKGES
jgi:hypothetical protein